MLAGACRTGRTGTETPAVPQQQLQEFNLETAYDSLTAAYGPWNDVEMPVSLSMEKPTHLSASGKAVMVYGEAISVSLRKIGFEVARLYLDNERVVLLSKPLRIAYEEDFDVFRSITGMNLADVQSALLGRVFVPSRGTAGSGDRRSFEFEADNAVAGNVVWRLIPRGSRTDITFSAVYPLITGNGLVRLTDIDIMSAGGVNFNFTGHSAGDCGITAGMLRVSAAVSGRQLNVGLEWSADRAIWNGGARIAAPVIPNNYRRLTTRELLNMLKRM